MIPFVIDCDGTLTNGTVLYPGKQRFFNVRDGHGINRLQRETNIMPIVMSGENDDSIRNRCEWLGVKHVLGVEDKLKTLILLPFMPSFTKHELDVGQFIAIGDDLPDYDLLQQATIAFCPQDAHPEILNLVREKGMVIKRNGGDGAVRAAIDMIMSSSWVSGYIPDFKVCPQKE